MSLKEEIKDIKGYIYLMLIFLFYIGIVLVISYLGILRSIILLGILSIFLSLISLLWAIIDSIKNQ